MAKKDNKGTSSNKVILDKKNGKGKHKKNHGPNDQKPKKYRGQGRWLITVGDMLFLTLMYK